PVCGAGYVVNGSVCAADDGGGVCHQFPAPVNGSIALPDAQGCFAGAAIRVVIAVDGRQLGGLGPGLSEWTAQSGSHSGRRSGVVAGLDSGYRPGSLFRGAFAEPEGLRSGYGAGVLSAGHGVGGQENAPGAGGLAGGGLHLPGGVEVATAKHARGGGCAGRWNDRAILAGASLRE